MSISLAMHDLIFAKSNDLLNIIEVFTSLIRRKMMSDAMKQLEYWLNDPYFDED